MKREMHILLLSLPLFQRLLNRLVATLKIQHVVNILIKDYSPEILESDGYCAGSDFWALGVIIYELLVHTRPFQGKTKAEYIKIAKYSYPENHNLPHSVMSLIRGLLEVSLDLRLGCNEMGCARLKEHRFFRTIKWNQVATKNLNHVFVPSKKQNFDVAECQPFWGMKDQAKVSFFKNKTKFRKFKVLWC
jgi:serine/threonine protein kinase